MKKSCATQEANCRLSTFILREVHSKQGVFPMLTAHPHVLSACQYVPHYICQVFARKKREEFSAKQAQNSSREKKNLKLLYQDNDDIFSVSHLLQFSLNSIVLTIKLAYACARIRALYVHNIKYNVLLYIKWEKDNRYVLSSFPEMYIRVVIYIIMFQRMGSCH